MDFFSFSLGGGGGGEVGEGRGDCRAQFWKNVSCGEVQVVLFIIYLRSFTNFLSYEINSATIS